MSFTPAVAETLRQALATVVVVPVTPLHADGNPDWDAYAALTRRADRRRDHGHHPERQHRRVLRAQPGRGQAGARDGGGRQQGAGPRPSCWPGSATTSPPRSRRPGTPGDHGARMIMIHQPVHPYVSREGWIDYHAAIAERGPRPRRRALHQERAHHRRGHRRARRPGAERHRRQVRRPRRQHVRRGGQGRRDRPVHLAGRRGRADRARLLGVRRAAASPRAWPTSTPPCRWPCWTRCAATTSATR